MTGCTPESEEPGTDVRKPGGIHYAIIGAVCAVVIGIYAWSARSGVLVVGELKAEQSYYNLLAQGFQAGQLNLKKELPSELAQRIVASDPITKSPRWLMDQRLLDLSYYQGEFHLYFGAMPVLVLFWPCVLVTGRYLLHQGAVVLFFSVGFLVSTGLLWALWRRYFGQVSVGVLAAVVLAVGLVSFTPAILQSCDVYEVAISCGYSLMMVALLLLWRAIQAQRSRSWWLAGASLAYGLALGARPSLLFGAVVLLVPVLWGRQKAEGRRQNPSFFILPSSFTVWLAAAGPIAAVGLGLLLYNFLRFEDPLEFGQRYQLPLSWHQQFSLRFLWSNFCVSFLEPARWSGCFPFVHGIKVPPLPEGSGGVYDAFGVLSNLPLVWMALAAPLAWHGHQGEQRRNARGLATAVGLLFGTGAVTLCLHDSMCLRYEVEFACALVLLAMMGLFGLEQTLTGRGGWRFPARWLWGLLLLFSIVFNLFAMTQRISQSYVWRGVISFNKSRLDEAIILYRKALKLQPDNADAHTSLGAALFKQGKVPEALAYLENAIRLKPDATAQASLGFVLLRQGMLPQAIGHLEEALRLNPRHAEAYDILVEALVRLREEMPTEGKLDGVFQEHQRIMQVNANSPQFHDSFGRTLSRLGRYAEAVVYFRKALELEPQWVPALNNLAWILATETNATVRNVEEAMQLAEQACELTTNSVAIYLDTLGVAYSEAGRFKEAVQATERAATQARQVGNQELATLMESRLEHYRASRAYRQIPKETAR